MTDWSAAAPATMTDTCADAGATTSSKYALITEEYFSATKSLIKRFGAAKTNPESSHRACNGRIQVLNCCCGISPPNRCRQCCQGSNEG